MLKFGGPPRSAPPDTSTALVGLALSGGGIRSATFALGVLEKLKELGVLKRVDYLSTVSGGGFIGGWLSANCARNPGWLERNTDWSPSIAHLRDFSNYLSPRVIITTNALPRLSDHSDGMRRRLRPLHFPVTIPAEQRNPHLSTMLCAELPGIFNWALEGRRRLYARGRFVDSAEALAMIEEMSPEPSPAELFVREQCEFVAGARSRKADVLEAFEAWAAAQGRMNEDVTDKKLAAAVRNEYPRVKTGKEGSGERAPLWVGLRLRVLAESEVAA